MMMMMCDENFPSPDFSFLQMGTKLLLHKLNGSHGKNCVEYAKKINMPI